MATYKVLIEMERELGDDIDIILAKPAFAGLTLGEALKRQIVGELQHAYDCPDCAIAGSFWVVRGPEEVAFTVDFDEIVKCNVKPTRRFIIQYTVAATGDRINSVELEANTADEAISRVADMFSESAGFKFRSANPV